MPTATLLLRDEEGSFRELSSAGQPLCFGRGPDNDVIVMDRGVSRRHAIFDWLDGSLRLRQLSGTSPTYLNGLRVEDSAVLSDGDQVRVSRCHLLVRLGPSREGDRELLEGQARPEELPDVTMAMPALESPPVASPDDPRLAMLSELSHTLRGLTELEDILTVLLGVAFDIATPTRGVVLLRDSDQTSLRCAVAHPDAADQGYSRSVVRHALERRATLVVADTSVDERFRAVASLEENAVRSVICCPLIARGEILGALYLDAASAWVRAREADVGLLNLLACYVASAIDGALLRRDRDRERGLLALDAEPVVARSAAMSQLLQELDGLARAGAELLLEGETGTGKLLLARRVHMTKFGAAAPFVTMDCRELSGRDLRVLLFGDGTSASRGAWQRAVGGSLVLEHLGALDLLGQQLLLDRLESSAQEEEVGRPQLVLTSSAGLKSLVEKQGFSARLAERLNQRVVKLPRLRERGEDILPLAQHFLAAVARERSHAAKRLSPAARKLLLGAKYREGNAAELREAMALADLLSETQEIDSEHVFTGATGRNHRFESEIASLAPVRWLTRRRVQRTLQGLVVAVFAVITGSCLLFASGSVGRGANALIWGLWWPGLLLVFVGLGRLWCTWCPISTLSVRAQSVWNLRAKAPQWIKEHGQWLTAGLFLVIVWAEHVFGMPEHPRATGWFLLSLVGLGLLAALATPREVWCRYACPLGNLAAAYSPAGTIHVHANPAICSTQCKTHECHKGSEQERGCPMFLHPLYVKDAHYCKLCLSCVRSCPNGSARIWMRPPLQDIWSLREVNPTLVPIGLTVLLLAPLLLATTRDFAFTQSLPGFTLASIALAACAIPLARWLPRWLSREGEPQLATRVVFALSLLAWGPFFAFHLSHVPGLPSLAINEAQFAEASLLPMSGGVGLLGLLQAMLIFLSTLMASAIVERVHSLALRESPAPSLRPWWLLRVFVVLYGAAALAMVAW